MKAVPQLSFTYVEEQSDPFLALFPHRFDYIWAEFPDHPRDKVNWKTETRYPLSDRQIQQAGSLFGVRFGTETQYCLLDIDINSVYHPQQDPFAVARIVAALELLGLTDYLACTSSYSGGLHLYFPFNTPQNSWKLAIALTTLLANTGFKVAPGQLEIFPNPKAYRVAGKPSLFNAHRLPLQIGSYLLNSEFEAVWSDRTEFIRQWCFAQSRNAIETTRLNQLVKQAKRKPYQISGKAEKFIRDLDTEIELGWTDFGQTNRLLGRITLRTYIFHHVIHGGHPLSGQALVNEIVNVARSLPGYQEWCRHQHEIEHRVEEWVRCIENSHYFHYSDPAGKYKSKAISPEAIEITISETPSWNQQQSEGARERIRKAIADLLNKNALPIGATARFKVLTQSYSIGGGSLYRHRDLWHPSYLETSYLETDSVSGVGDISEEREGNQGEGINAEDDQNYQSLLSPLGGNLTGQTCSSDRLPDHSDRLGSNHSEQRVFQDSFQVDCDRISAFLIDDLEFALPPCWQFSIKIWQMLQGGSQRLCDRWANVISLIIVQQGIVQQGLAQLGRDGWRSITRGWLNGG